MITLYREDFVLMSDGSSPFDSFLSEFDVPEGIRADVVEIEVHIDQGSLIALNDTRKILTRKK